ncbi:MAG: hypothetical protein LBJ64_10915 [Deltaproteobacteria bacterium]|jgi:hypothetical protein|nr:hypothetical protein [Deltaproteobacteria bacterium]
MSSSDFSDEKKFGSISGDRAMLDDQGLDLEIRNIIDDLDQVASEFVDSVPISLSPSAEPAEPSYMASPDPLDRLQPRASADSRLGEDEPDLSWPESPVPPPRQLQSGQPFDSDRQAVARPTGSFGRQTRPSAPAFSPPSPDANDSSFRARSAPSAQREPSPNGGGRQAEDWTPSSPAGRPTISPARPAAASAAAAPPQGQAVRPPFVALKYPQEQADLSAGPVLTARRPTEAPRAPHEAADSTLLLTDRLETPPADKANDIIELVDEIREQADLTEMANSGQKIADLTVEQLNQLIEQAAERVLRRFFSNL